MDYYECDFLTADDVMSAAKTNGHTRRISSAVCWAWDSIEDAIDYGQRDASPQWRRDNATRNSRLDRGEGGGPGNEWAGASSWGEAVKIATEGWVDGRESVATAVDAIWESGATKISSGDVDGFDVAGHMPDVSSYIAGDPCHMHSFGDDTGESPVIRLLVSVCTNCNTDPRSMINRAAALAALVDVVESSGSSCEIWALIPSISGSKYCLQFVNIKGAGIPLDLDRVSFGLGHPAMLRRISFALTEVDEYCSSKGGSSFYHGYGRTVDLPDACHPKDMIYFSSLNDSNERNYRTPESSAQAVLRLYNSQAVDKNLKEVGQG